MLNGLEKTLERKLPVLEQRWQVAEAASAYGQQIEPDSTGWPEPET